MSISKPRAGKTRNPAVSFSEWSGGGKQGWFSSYDKESKKNITTDLSNGIIILEKDLMSITGFMQPKSQITSNEIIRGSSDVLTVKKWTDGKSETILEGAYEQIKDKVFESKDLHYTLCIYYVDPKDWQLRHLKLKGANVGGWFDEIEKKETNALVLHVNTTDHTQGNVDYKKAHFAYGRELTNEEFDKAIEIDGKILQPYLEAYLKTKPGEAQDNQEYHQEEPKDIDSSQWREAKANGKLLKDFLWRDLIELGDELSPDDPFQDYIQFALSEYSAALNNWGYKKDKDGRCLTDYSIYETEEALSKVSNAGKNENPVKIILEVALAEKKTREAIVKSQVVKDEVLDFDDKDDIPF